MAELGEATARARSIGAMWGILGIIQQLQLDQTWQELVAGRSNRTTLSQHLTALLCNRLDDPRSKLGVLEWLQTVVIPGNQPRWHHLPGPAADHGRADRAQGRDREAAG